MRFSANKIFTFLSMILILGGTSLSAQEEDLSTAALQPPEIVSPPPAKYLDASARHYQAAPSIAVAPNGRLWCLIMTGDQDEGNENRIDVITSSDGGATWSNVKFVIDIPGPVRQFDPNIWSDPEGRIWIFWTQCYDFWDGRGGLWTIVSENPGEEDAQWSAPRRICDGDMKTKPLVTKNGDYFLFVEQWPEGNIPGWAKQQSPKWLVRAEPNGQIVYRSSDKGATFEMIGTVPVDQSQRNFDEAMAIEREDGSLRMLIRQTYGFGESVSTDCGKTWTKVQPATIKNPSSRLCWRKLQSGAILLVKNGPIDAQIDRSDMTAYLSEDNGETFPYKLELDMRKNTRGTKPMSMMTGPSYPDFDQAQDGTIYCVHDHDRAGTGEIMFHIFTEEDVKAGKIVSKQGELFKTIRTNAQN